MQAVVITLCEMLQLKYPENSMSSQKRKGGSRKYLSGVWDAQDFSTWICPVRGEWERILAELSLGEGEG